MPAEIRRIILQIPTKQIEGGLAETAPTELIATMAIIKNSWFGHGLVKNLRPKFSISALRLANQQPK